MTTLSDIAKALGVSVATASNALTGKGRMRDELREEIIAAAAEMGYSSPGCSRIAPVENIIIIAEDISVSFCADIVGGIVGYAAEMGKAFPVFSLGTYEKHGPRPDEIILKTEIKRLLSAMTPKAVTGIIFVADTPRRFEKLFDGVSCPVVYTYCQSADDSPSVNYNNRQGARLAASTMISHGAKKIAMFSGLLDSIPMSNRMFGYQLALNDAGIPFDPAMLHIGDWTLESGYRLALEMIRTGEIPDAIFSQNDEMAAGICQAFAENGIKVPDEVEVIGFDDKELAAYTYPPLSTVRPPLKELGIQAAKIMLDLTSGSEEKAPQNTFLPCTLVERGTTKKIS